MTRRLSAISSATGIGTALGPTAVAFVILTALAIGLAGCGRKPGDVSPPPAVEDDDPFPRSYPSS